MPDNKYEPKIIGFFCKWCTSAAADLAGTSRKQYPPNLVPIRFFCSSRLDPQQILHAFENGADGVMIGGCHFGDCNYQTGNYKTPRRIAFLHDLLSKLGIDKRRLRLEWISAAGGGKVTRVITEFTKDIRDLGPLGGIGK